MRAVGLMVHGGPEALEVIDLDEVTAGPGDSYSQLCGSGQPDGHRCSDGTRAKLQSQFLPPYVPGMDAAGIVDQVGERTTGVRW